MDNLLTTTELAAVIPETWSANFYPTLLQNIVFADSIARDYEGEIAGLGDTVNVTNFPEFGGAKAISENEVVEAVSIVAGNTQLIIDQLTALDYVVTLRAQKQSLEHANALRELAMHAILKKMQSLIIADIAPSTSAPDHTISYASGTTLALADILSARKLLDAQSVPDDGKRVLVTGTNQWNDMYNITGFTSRDFIPVGNPLVDGKMSPQVLGFNPKMTAAVSNTTYAFHPIFMQLAVQMQPLVEVFNTGATGLRGLRVNTTVLWGKKQFSNLRVVQIG
jgi:hypothetical protein